MEIAEAPQAERGSPQSRRIAILLAAALAVIAVVAFVALRAGTAGQASSETADGQSAAITQKSEGGNVTVAVTWGGVNAGAVFDVRMDTHSVNLDGIDLADRALLRVDGREVQPLGWDASQGGHHRSGTLTFPATAADGTPLLGSAGSVVELIIRDVAGVPERVFRWTP